MERWPVWPSLAGKRGALSHGALVAKQCSSIRRLGASRRNEMRFHRLLRNPGVTAAEMAQAVCARAADAVAGRDIAVIQDTSGIHAGGKDLAAKGFGPAGKGGATRGVLAHVAIAVDVKDGGLPGLADFAVWNRAGGAVATERKRACEDKESDRRLKTARTAGGRLAQARSITVVSDAGSDIHGTIAAKPERCRAPGAGPARPGAGRSCGFLPGF